jgi:hypothetical protein
MCGHLQPVDDALQPNKACKARRQGCPTVIEHWAHLFQDRRAWLAVNLEFRNHTVSHDLGDVWVGKPPVLEDSLGVPVG